MACPFPFSAVDLGLPRLHPLRPARDTPLSRPHRPCPQLSLQACCVQRRPLLRSQLSGLNLNLTSIPEPDYKLRRTSLPCTFLLFSVYLPSALTSHPTLRSKGSSRPITAETSLGLDPRDPSILGETSPLRLGRPLGLPQGPARRDPPAVSGIIITDGVASSHQRACSLERERQRERGGEHAPLKPQRDLVQKPWPSLTKDNRVNVWSKGRSAPTLPTPKRKLLWRQRPQGIGLSECLPDSL